MGILMCGLKLGKFFMGLGFTLTLYIYHIKERSQEFILGWARISSKSRRYEKISLNRKKNTPSQGGHNEPYPLMHILYIK